MTAKRGKPAVKQFRAVLTSDRRGACSIGIPFDPDEVWGAKPRHHVTGSIDGITVRGALIRNGDSYALPLGPAWLRDSGLRAGERIIVELAPEGPQREGLDEDIASALDANPAAAAYFDGLAQFYRKGYLTWITSTKNRPDERAARIAKTVDALAAGLKQRPRD